MQAQHLTWLELARALCLLRASRVPLRVLLQGLLCSSRLQSPGRTRPWHPGGIAAVRWNWFRRCTASCRPRSGQVLL